MDGTGPDSKGRSTGRGLGNCSPLSQEEKTARMGKGLGKRRKADDCNKGQGKRLRSGL